MSLICFKNGSLARERIRDEHGLDWERFSRALRETPAGNGGALILPWFDPEITPRVNEPGVHRRHLDAADAARNVRAVVEAQMMAMANHAEPIVGGRVSRVLATGGASANRDVLQVMADVFGATVYQSPSDNAACLGAALRAFHAHQRSLARDVSWDDVGRGLTDPSEESRVDPIPAHVTVFADARRAYAAFEQDVTSRRRT
jgi:xylulokinase